MLSNSELSSIKLNCSEFEAILLSSTATLPLSPLTSTVLATISLFNPKPFVNFTADG